MRYYGLTDMGKVVYLGDHEDEDDVDIVCMGLFEKSDHQEIVTNTYSESEFRQFVEECKALLPH